MKRYNIYLLTLSLLFCSISTVNVFSQNLPERPNPPRLVNDFAGMLTADEVNSLEQKLVSFNDSTSTQIAIVTVSTMSGYDKCDYAQRLGEKWGVGQKGLNNGILIVVKSKTQDSNGDICIATAYGAEGAVPDMVCAEIVDYEILPAFKSGYYYTGLDDATNTLMSLVRGEFTAEQYGNSRKEGKSGDLPIGLIIFIIFIVISFITGKGAGGNNKNISSKSLPFWLLLGMMNSGRGSHSGSWGGFSGGGSSGGGFGGFGGGSFGGGGAGGSW